VQASIQGDQLRVTSRSKDAPQDVMAASSWTGDGFTGRATARCAESLFA
jgi:hypothetical protein